MAPETDDDDQSGCAILRRNAKYNREEAGRIENEIAILEGRLVKFRGDVVRLKAEAKGWEEDATYLENAS